MCGLRLWLIVSGSLLALLSGPAGGETLLDYDFSDASGTTVTDLTGNGNDGTLVGFADTTAGAGAFNASEGWVAGGGLCFIDDGVRSYVETPLPLSALPGDFTVEFEANYAGASGWTPAIGSDATGCCAESFFFGINSNQTNAEVRLQDSGGAVGNHPWTSVPDETTHHIALVYDAATDGVEVFVDGASVGTATRAAANMGGVSTNFIIGNTGWSAGEQWDGVIFGVAISDEKLAPGNFAIPNRPVPEASVPDPADGAVDVRPDVQLTWTPGELAVAHDIYFGADPDDVLNADRGNPLDVLVRQNQSEAVFDPGTLEFGRTYYWRVDEAGTDGVIFAGPVWSFTLEPYLFALDTEQIIATATSSQKADMGPEKTIDGSGLSADGLHSTDPTDMWLSSPAGPQPTFIEYEFDAVYKLYEMWVWNYNMIIEPTVGFGFKDALIEYSVDGEDWATLDAVEQFSQGPGEEDYAHNTVVDFNGVTARYVRITAESNFQGQGQYGLSEVRFLYLPVRAREPQPASGQEEVPLDVLLNWQAGREAALHELSLSTDEQAVANGTALIDAFDDSTYDAGLLDLQLDQAYYWKVTEVNEAETPARWDSDVWSFSTIKTLVIDDFEGYDDDYENYNRVFQVWIDGAGYTQPEPGNPGNGSGSLVGTSAAPWVEQSIVHSGGQAMPLSYNNTAAPFYSQADRTLAPAQDWTQGGVQYLTLYFRGAVGNVDGQLYVEINGVRKVFDGDADALQKPLWTLWKIELASANTDLENVTTLSIGVDGAAATGTVYIDDIALYREAPPEPQDPGTDNLVAWYAMDNNALDGSGNGNDGLLVGGARYIEDDYRGTVLGLDGTDGIVEVPHAPSIGFNEATNLTVTLWLRPDKLPRASWTGVITKNRDVSPDDAYGIWISNTNNWHFRVRSAAGNANLPAAPGPTEEWHFIAMTHDVDATTLRGYLDGRMIYENTNSDPAPFAADSPLWIGGAQDVMEYYPGLIDDVRIYDRALSESEVSFVGAQ